MVHESSQTRNLSNMKCRYRWLWQASQLSHNTELLQKHFGAASQLQHWAACKKIRIRLGQIGWLHRLVILVGYIGWLHWLVTLVGYIGWLHWLLHWLVTLVGYIGWLHWLVTLVGYIG